MESGPSRLAVETSESGGDRFSCNDSLGMLSTVALYHSELSGSEGKETEKEREAGNGKGREGSATTVVKTVGDGMARMRLESSCGKSRTVGHMYSRSLGFI